MRQSTTPHLLLVWELIIQSWVEGQLVAVTHHGIDTKTPTSWYTLFGGPQRLHYNAGLLVVKSIFCQRFPAPSAIGANLLGICLVSSLDDSLTQKQTPFCML